MEYEAPILMRARTAFETEYLDLVQRSRRIHTIGDAIQTLWRLTVDGVIVLCNKRNVEELTLPYLRYIETTTG